MTPSEDIAISVHGLTSPSTDTSVQLVPESVDVKILLPDEPLMSGVNEATVILVPSLLIAILVQHPKPSDVTSLQLAP